MICAGEALVTQHLQMKKLLNDIMHSSEHSLDIESEEGEKLNFDYAHEAKYLNFLLALTTKEQGLLILCQSRTNFILELNVLNYNYSDV